MSFIQALLWAVNYLLARLLWRARIEGRLEIPPGQGAVIVGNHRGPADPSFIQLSTRRVVHWMVAKEYAQRPALRWLLRTCQVIPVSRGGTDTAATRAAIRCAQQGGLVGLFPEGRINDTADILLPGRPGAAMIALKAGVPVVPCHIAGSPYRGSIWDPLRMRAQVRLILGPPMDLSAYCGREDDRAAIEELTLRILKEIARLGGQPDFEPRLAGRTQVAKIINAQP